MVYCTAAPLHRRVSTSHGKARRKGAAAGTLTVRLLLDAVPKVEELPRLCIHLGVRCEGVGDLAAAQGQASRQAARTGLLASGAGIGATSRHMRAVRAGSVGKHPQEGSEMRRSVGGAAPRPTHPHPHS